MSLSAVTNDSDERRPLLSPAQVEEGPFTGDEPLADAPPLDKEELTWRWFIFYGVSLSFALLAVTLLIKGFIDAGDTGVSAFLHKTTRAHAPRYSSTSQAL